MRWMGLPFRLLLLALPVGYFPIAVVMNDLKTWRGMMRDVWHLVKFGATAELPSERR